MDATLYGPGEGEVLASGASTVVLKAGSQQTGGTFYLSESTIEPGFPGPPPHTHSKLHDMFYVLEGTLTVQLGDEVHNVGAGTFACAPPGVVHTFRNESDTPVRMLNFSTPGGFEVYLRELTAMLTSGDGFDGEAFAGLAARSDIQVA